MTAHILFTALDPDAAGHPVARRDRADHPRHDRLRRRAGDRRPRHARAVRRTRLRWRPQALAAGCDLALHCSGEPEPTAALLAACPEITPAAAARLQAGARPGPGAAPDAGRRRRWPPSVRRCSA